MCSATLLKILLLTFITSVVNAVPLSEQMAASVIARHTLLGLNAEGAPLTTYEHGVFERALEMIFNKTENSTYYEYLKTGVDNLISNNGTLLDYNFTEFTLDDLRLGPEFVYLYERTGEEKYKAAADTLRNQLNSQPRNPDGGFWHRVTYPNQMWLDGIYMVEPFYAQHTSFFHPKNLTAFDDIVLQFSLLFTHALNATSSLLKHAWDETLEADWADPITGQSPEVWGRALGWYSMALVETLDYLPSSHTSELVSQLISLAPAILSSRDTNSSLWWDVMSQPGRAENYIESSSSSMFIASLLKAARKGYIDPSVYQTTLEHSYKRLVDMFVVKLGNGTLDWEGTVQVGDPGTFEEYMAVPLSENDLKGIGPFIFASVEYEAALARRTR